MKTAKTAAKDPGPRGSRKKFLIEAFVLILFAGASIGRKGSNKEGCVLCVPSVPSLNQELAEAEFIGDNLSVNWDEDFSTPETASVDAFSADANVRYEEHSIPPEIFYSKPTKADYFTHRLGEVALTPRTDFKRFGTYTARPNGPRFDLLRGTFTEAGGGLEYRTSKSTRVFVEATRVSRDEEKYTDVLRFGMRYEF